MIFVSKLRPSGSKKIIRYVIEAASGVVPFAGGLLSMIVSIWSDNDQDQINADFRQQLGLFVNTAPLRVIFTEQEYRAEVMALQHELQCKAYQINRPKLFNFQSHAMDRQVEAMIYTEVYKRKIEEVQSRKDASDHLYEIEAQQIKLQCNDQALRDLELQKLQIKYGKVAGYEVTRPRKLMSIVAR